MNKRITRRNFVRTGLAAGAVLPTAAAAAPTFLKQAAVKPLVIASDNGNQYKNGGNVTCVQKAYEMMVKGDDVLDALIAGVNVVELDPEDNSVGYGGIPNADGVVQLDASCMHGPKRRAGAVACLEGVRTPSLVAQAVLDTTDHHLLVGAGAQTFARNMGFKIESDLNTPDSRKIWLEWKRRIDPSRYLDPKTRAELWHRERLRLAAEGRIHPAHIYTGPSTATALTLRATFAVSRLQADYRSRYRDAWAIHRSSAPGYMSTTQLVRQARPGGVRPIFIISARFSLWRRCGEELTRRMPA